MFILSVTTGPSKGQAIQLIMGGSITIGRSWESNVYFDDPLISGLHAEVTWGDDGFTVFDLSTETGTFVNGTRIKGRARLRLGDHIQIGSLILLLKQTDLRESPALGASRSPAGADSGPKLLESGGDQILAFDAQKTVIAERGLIAVARAPSIPEPSAGPLLILKGHTVIASGVEFPTLDSYAVSQASELKRIVSSPESEGALVVVRRADRLDPFASVPVSIGREVTSGIAIDDPAASQSHAVIDLRQGRYLVRDTGSANGTFLNGKRVVEQKLSDGDTIGIGGHNLLVVLGERCLGLQVQPPSIAGGPQRPPSREPSRLGIVDKPLGDPKDRAKSENRGGERKRKKKASELVWYATSDLDKGVFRARSAFVALALGMIITAWMLAKGDSEVLAGSRLSHKHEDDSFLQMATSRGRQRCAACHVGIGRVSTLKCLDCHPSNRPSSGHADADIDCTACHLEHKGSSFRSPATAAITCVGCHASPHDRLVRQRSMIVAGFRIDAPADVAFHLKHQAKQVACLTCHGSEVATASRGARAACGQCHAPEDVTAQDCKMCHKSHPDRDVTVNLLVAPIESPPRFATKGFLWSMGLLVLSFAVAALIPRRRRVMIGAPGDQRGG